MGDGSKQQLSVDTMTANNCTNMLLPARSFYQVFR